MTYLIFVGEVGKLGGGILGKIGIVRGYEVLTNLYCGYSIIESQSCNIFISHVTTLGHDIIIDMWPFDINLGFHWQMTHVEYASDVVHLHNIEW